MSQTDRPRGSRGVHRWLLHLLGLVAVLAGVAAPMLTAASHQVVRPAAAVAAPVTVVTSVTITPTPTPAATPTAKPVAAVVAAPVAAAVAAVAVRRNLVVLGDSVASGFACDCGGSAALPSGPSSGMPVAVPEQPTVSNIPARGTRRGRQVT